MLSLTVDEAARALNRFFAKVRADGECQTWTGARQSGGYGALRINGRNVRAHRIAWVLAHRAPVPEGMVIRHRCDNPPCCNPEHLVLGTRRDNVRDMIERGRSPILATGHTHSRRSVCKNGHNLDAPGARKNPKRGRMVGDCRACYNARRRARRVVALRGRAA